MENTIKVKVTNALSKLFDKDLYLLINDLNERTIAHKFAAYLQEQFVEFNVDCEYNKNVDEENGSKNIYVLKIECEELRKKIKKELTIADIDYSVLSIYPDIIIHNRGENSGNLVIIEIKKSTNITDRNFDYKKLQCYTDKARHNKLQYSYGLFIEFETCRHEPQMPELIWYKDGERLS